MAQFMKMFQPIVYALTGSRFLAALTNQAQSLTDVQQIITGQSPIIADTLQAAQDSSRSASRSSADRSASGGIPPDWIDIAIKIANGDFDFDFGDGGINLDFFNSDIMKKTTTAILSAIAFWQLRKTIDAGGNDKKYAEILEKEYLDEMVTLSAKIGQLYNAAKEGLGNEGRLTNAAQAMYAQSMGNIRTQAVANRDEATARMAAMGSSPDAISATFRSIDDQILSQSSTGMQNAFMYDAQNREQTRNYMTSLISMQQQLADNKYKIAETHYRLAAADAAEMDRLIQSIVNTYFRVPDFSYSYEGATSQNVTVEGGGGGIPGIPGVARVAGKQVGTTQSPTGRNASRVKSVVINDDGTASVEEMDSGEPTPTPGGPQINQPGGYYTGARDVMPIAAPQPMALPQANPNQSVFQEQLPGQVADYATVGVKPLQTGAPTPQPSTKKRYVYNSKTGMYDLK